MNSFFKNLSMWLVIGLVVLLLWKFFNHPQVQIEDMAYSDFIAEIQDGKISSVEIQGNEISAIAQENRRFKTYAPADLDLIKTLRTANVKIVAKPTEDNPWYITILISWFPMLLLIGVWIFFMRQMQAGGGKAMSFGKSRARLMNQEEIKVTFKNVAGIDEAKEELSEIIDFLKDPKKFTKLGGRIPKGVLLMGPPGTGKTLLAKAIAGEAEVPFFSISGSDFVEMFVGVGASRVRDLFTQGKKNAPCIIFIDEIDAVGRHRGAGLGGGHDEREQTLNQLLVEMDGFESNEGVIIVSATNRPDVLDPALLRPGRFDRQVVVPIPDVKGREQILKVHAQKIPLEEGVNWAVIARGTPGFSGADLENMVNEAALLAARLGHEQVSMVILEKAKDKVMMGTERRSMMITDQEKEITAYHEAGHALVGRLLPGTDPIHKVTIIPRGRALGLTQYLPIDERHTLPKSYLLNRLCILLGGRVAEQVIFNELTTGAGNDLERATEIARKMVCEWGMSDTMGPLTFGKKEEQIFLGREIAQHRDYSEATAIRIDEEVKALVVQANEKVTRLLSENVDLLRAIAKSLLEKETITLEDIDALMDSHDVQVDNEASGADARDVADSSATPVLTTKKVQKEKRGTTA